MDNQVSKDINPTWRYPPVESPDQRMIRWWTWRGRKKVPQCRCWLCTGRSRRCLRARSLRALSPCCSHWTGGLQVNIVSQLYIFPRCLPTSEAGVVSVVLVLELVTLAVILRAGPALPLTDGLLLLWVNIVMFHKHFSH